MAFCWLARDGPTLNADLVALWFVRGPVFEGNSIFLLFFRGVRTPCPPPPPQIVRTWKNNLDPGQATMVVFQDTMYTFRDTQGGGVKIDNFFSYLTFVTSSRWSKYCMRWSFGGGGGGKGPGPPGKTQVIWESIRNKQLDPLEKVGPPPPPPPPGKNVEAHLEPPKIIIFFEINHWHSVKKMEDY